MKRLDDTTIEHNGKIYRYQDSADREQAEAGKQPNGPVEQKEAT